MKKILVLIVLTLMLISAPGQYTDPFLKIPERKRKNIATIEMSIGLGLISTGIILSRTWDNRQGIEFPCFVFGTVFLIEGNHIRNTVRRKYSDRYLNNKITFTY